MPVQCKASGAWKTISSVDDCYVKVSGAWKKCSQVYVKVDGTWKRCFYDLVTGTNSQWIGELKYQESFTITNVKIGSILTLTGYILWTWTASAAATFFFNGATPYEQRTPYDYAGNSEYTDSDPTWFSLTATATSNTVTITRGVPNSYPQFRSYDLNVSYTYEYYQ